MEQQPVYYGEYLQLDKIINAQQPESFKEGQTPAHDEMLFIIIHQAYELWFKQILFELDAVAAAMEKPTLNDNSNDMQSVVQRLNRIATIMNVLVHQVDILETMTPMDFLEFRDLLRPASGFQSWQFKIVEAKLGLRFEHRHGQDYYTSQLKPEDIQRIKTIEQGSTLLQLINKWLERMPFLKDETIWNSTAPIQEHEFWKSFESVYSESLNEHEKNNTALFRKIFFEEDGVTERSLSAEASRSALFIMLYRGYPILEMPFQILELLLEIDNQMGNWRYRHINMVRRMIGTRTGTGGSTGSGYLQGAMEKHYIFKEISQLNSFLINKSKLPRLPEALVQKLGYHF
jgi:tryptophan 2,3-dioxygenase